MYCCYFNIWELEINGSWTGALTIGLKNMDNAIYVNWIWSFQIVEFISVLLGVGTEVAVKELIHLGAVQRILDLFFE